MNAVRYVEAEGINKTELSVDVSSLFRYGYTPPRFWEVLGSIYGKNSYIRITGLCRIDETSGNMSVVLEHVGAISTPSTSINADGILTVMFGSSWSYVRLRVFY